MRKTLGANEAFSRRRGKAAVDERRGLRMTLSQRGKRVCSATGRRATPEGIPATLADEIKGRGKPSPLRIRMKQTRLVVRSRRLRDLDVDAELVEGGLQL